MDNKAREKLRTGALTMGISLDSEAITRLLVLREELLKWNVRFNLTAIRDPDEILEKHFLDSLAILPEVGLADDLLDVGAGAGFPGLPIGIANSQLKITMVDSVSKKVAFIKHAIGLLRMAPGARGIHSTLKGKSEAEGIQRTHLAVSRAFASVPDWLALAGQYLLPNGRVIAMLGRKIQVEDLEREGLQQGLVLVSARDYVLPWSGDPRQIAVWQDVPRET